MNGVHFLVFAFTVFGATYWIPRLVRHDRNMAALERLDDEELAALLEEFPDALNWAKR